MRFELGSRVKWKKATPIRLGYSPRDIGRVVGIHQDTTEELELDVEFGDGEVLHGAMGDWFEPVEYASDEAECAEAA